MRELLFAESDASRHTAAAAKPEAASAVRTRPRLLPPDLRHRRQAGRGLLRKIAGSVLVTTAELVGTSAPLGEMGGHVTIAGGGSPAGAVVSLSEQPLPG